MNTLMQVCTAPVLTAYGATTNLVTEYTAQVCISVAQNDYMNHISSVWFNAMQFFNGFLG